MPQKYNYKSPRTGKDYKFSWTQPTPITPDDFDKFKTYIQQREEQEFGPERGALSHIPGADTAWNIGKATGKRLGEIGESVWGSIPAVQAARFNKKFSELKKDPTALEADKEAWNSQVGDPFSRGAKALDIADPTGLGLTALSMGQSTVEDIKNKNWGGIAGNAIALGAPYALGRLVRGIKRPEDLPRKPKITVVPDAEPPQIAPSEIIPPSRQLTEIAGQPASKKRVTVYPPKPKPKQLTEVAGDLSGIRRIPRTQPPAGFLPPHEPDTRFLGHPVGKVGDVLDPNTPESLQSLNLRRPGTTHIPDDPSSGPLPPIDSLPKVNPPQTTHAPTPIAPTTALARRQSTAIVPYNQRIPPPGASPTIPPVVPSIAPKRATFPQQPKALTPVDLPPAVQQPIAPPPVIPQQQPIAPVVPPPPPIDTSVIPPAASARIAQVNPPAVQQPKPKLTPERLAEIRAKATAAIAAKQAPVAPKPALVNRPPRIEELPKFGNEELDGLISEYKEMERARKATERRGYTEEQFERFSTIVRAIENHPLIPEEIKAGWKQRYDELAKQPPKFKPGDKVVVKDKAAEQNRVITARNKLEVVPQPKPVQQVQQPGALAPKPPLGTPGSPERLKYIAWEHGRVVRDKQAKLDRIKQMAPEAVNWNRDFGDPRINSIAEAEEQIQLFRNKEAEALEAVAPKPTPIKSGEVDTSVVPEGAVATLPKVEQPGQKVAKPKKVKAREQLIDEPGLVKTGPSVLWKEQLDALDAANAPDNAYMEILSTGSKIPLRGGETWRGRVIKFIKKDRELQARLAAEREGLEPQKMEVTGVKEGNTGLSNVAMGGGSKNTLTVIGSSLYTKPRPVTNVKELLQNAFDEHREHNIDEPVRVLINMGVSHPTGAVAEKGNTVTVRDRGKGLLPDEIYTVLTDVGESGKGGVESASGGFGFAKAAPFLGGKYVIVRSIVDTPKGRMMYTFEGNPDQLLNQKKGVALDVHKVSNDIPTGVEVSTWYDKDQEGFYDAGAYVKDIAQQSPNVSPIKFVRYDGEQPEMVRAWLDETPENPAVNAETGKPNYVKKQEKDYIGQPFPPFQDTFDIPGSRVNIHYGIEPGVEAAGADLIFSNKGMYQGKDRVGYGASTPNVPSRIVADINAIVEEGHKDYPFNASREKLLDHVTEAIDKWVRDNIVTGVKRARVAETQRMYDTTALLPTDKLDNPMHYLDVGNKLLPAELNVISNHPKMVSGLNVLNQIHKEILEVADSLGWSYAGWSTPDWTVPSGRLKKFGLLFEEPKTNWEGKMTTTFGIHIPRPDDINNSAILINLMEHFNDAQKDYVTTPLDKLTTTLTTTLIHEQAHIPGGGHDEGHSYRDAALHSALGKMNTVAHFEMIERAFGDGKGNLNPDVSKLLQIYNESRGREASGDNSIRETGISSERPTDINRGKGQDVEGVGRGEAKPKSISKEDVAAAVAKIKAKGIDKSTAIKKLRAGVQPETGGKLAESIETPVVAGGPPNWGGTPKVVSTGTGVMKGGTPTPIRYPKSDKLNLKPEPDLPSAPPKPSILPKNIPVEPVVPKPSLKSRSGTGEVNPNLVDVIPTAGEKKNKFVFTSDVKAGGGNKPPTPPKPPKTKASSGDDGGKGPKKPKKSVEDIIKEKQAKNPILKDPSLKDAIKALPRRIRKSSAYKALYEPYGVSTTTKLERLGEGGKKLSKLLRDERTASNRLGGSEAVHTRRIVRSLSKPDQLEVVKLLDGQKKVSEASSPEVAAAYKTLRESLDRLGNMAEAAGVRMKDSKGNNIPFKKHKGEYYPHHYPEELFKDPVALREKLLKAKDKQGNLIHSPAEVEAIMKQVTEQGERFSSPQHARVFDMPGYIEDLSVVRKHQYELARAIVRAKKFGPMDVSDAASPISKLIDETDNRTEAARMVNDYLERLDVGDKTHTNKVYNAIVKAEVASKLSQFAITNMGDLAGLSGNLGYRDTLSSIFKVLSSPHEAADYSTSVGALSTIEREMFDEVGKGNLLGKAYGITTTEKLIRTIGSMSGRAAANRAFALAKKNPKLASRLERFVEDDVQEVLKQDELTPEQLDFAAGRGVELSSGIPDKLTLSKQFFADNPIMRLPLLFKRFAFVYTKNMFDAIRAEPGKARKLWKAAKIVAATTAAGEAVGDTKEAIKGLVAGDVKGAISDRGDYIGTKNWYVNRLVADWLQSALFGIVGDVSESIVRRNVGKGSGVAGGPVWSDIDELLGIASNPDEKGLRGLGKAVTRRIPYVGQGLAEKYFPSDREKTMYPRMSN